MSIFREMHPNTRFTSWRDFQELKRMLRAAIERGFVQEIPVMTVREIPRVESWYLDKETGEIYSLLEPEPPARGMWEPVDMEKLRRSDFPVQ